MCPVISAGLVELNTTPLKRKIKAATAREILHKEPLKNGMMNKKGLSHMRHKLSGCGCSNVICFWEKVLDLISQIMVKESSLKP